MKGKVKMNIFTESYTSKEEINAFFNRRPVAVSEVQLDNGFRATFFRINSELYIFYERDGANGHHLIKAGFTAP
jgi:hypothetical protein